MNHSASFPTLKTERLFLRQLVPGDDKSVFSLRSNDTVNKYLDRPKTTTISYAREFINKINSAIQQGQSFYWAITLPYSDELIGTICLWNISEDKSTVEIGFELHPNFQGKGFMQEALLTTIEFSLQTLKFQGIIAYVHKGNEKSIKLLEKNGFHIDQQREIENRGNAEFSNLIAYLLAKYGE